MSTTTRRQCAAVLLLLSLVLPVGSAAGEAPPGPQTEEVPAEERLHIDHTTVVAGANRYAQILAIIVALEPSAPPGTMLQARIGSCGRTIVEARRTLDEDDTPGIAVDMRGYGRRNRFQPTSYLPYGRAFTYVPKVEAASLLGREYDVSVTVTHPDADPYELTAAGSVDTEDTPPRCHTVDRLFRTTIPVERWSRKMAPPRVGQHVKVTRLRAPGARVAYRWQANGETVGRRRSLFVDRSLSKRHLVAFVTVRQPGMTTVVQSLSY